MVITPVLAAMLAAPTQAQPPALELVWDAPAGCASQTTLRAVVDDLLRASPPQARAQVRAIATVRRRDHGRYDLHLRIRTPSGAEDRDLVADTCKELEEVTALAVAIAVDPGARVEPKATPAEPEPKPEPEPEPEREPDAVPESPPPPKQKATPPASPSVIGIVGVAGGLNVGPLPAPAGAVALVGGVMVRWLRVDLRVAHSFARTAQLAGGLGSGDVALTSAALRGCGVPSAGRVEFPLCVGMEAGAMHGRGGNVPDPQRSALPWVAALAGGGLRVLAHPWLALGIDAELLVPVVRPGFELDGLGELHRACAVGFGAFFVVELRPRSQI